MSDRLIQYQAHDALPGQWRARKVRFGIYVLEVELPCVNGLSAWFHVATINETEEAERLMTDGAKLEAGEYAERIVEAREASMSDLVERLRTSYAAVAEWPERRGSPMEVGGTGFLDLLNLRNIVPEAADRIVALEAEVERLLAERTQQQVTETLLRAKLRRQT
jgi:uncharacterized small protein (DUF1192 family)